MEQLDQIAGIIALSMGVAWPAVLIFTLPF